MEGPGIEPRARGGSEGGLDPQGKPGWVRSLALLQPRPRSRATPARCRMQALLPRAPPLFASAASMQEAAAAANAAAHQQLNAAALATMLVHGPPGQPYAPGALAQLLAFTAGHQPAWQAQAQALAGSGLPHPLSFADCARGGAAAPASGEGKTTNYAARHQARWHDLPRRYCTVPPPRDPCAPPRRVPRCPADARARRPGRRQLRSGGETASTTGWRR